MYGPGYDPRAGGDVCEKDKGQESFVYRIDTETLVIDRLYRAGPVPKYMAVTPDDGLLLVSNWCGFDVSVIDLRTHETLAEVEVGRYPRGIAVTSDGATAYLAVMGSTDIAVIDLSAFAADGASQDADESAMLSYLREVGDQPRHLVLSPDDEVLYLSLNGEDAVVALDAGTGQELRRVRTGTQPRSMDISDDGTALYVVNYESDTMSKLRTSDFEILQSFNTSHHPIGITYDSFNDEVWVSAYSGVIHVYAETEPAQTEECAPDGCDEQPDEEPPSEPETPEPQPTPVTSAPLTTAPQSEPLTFEQALAVAEGLAPDFVMPADCAAPPLGNSREAAERDARLPVRDPPGRRLLVPAGPPSRSRPRRSGGGGGPRLCGCAHPRPQCGARNRRDAPIHAPIHAGNAVRQPRGGRPRHRRRRGPPRFDIRPPRRRRCGCAHRWAGHSRSTARPHRQQRHDPGCGWQHLVDRAASLGTPRQRPVPGRRPVHKRHPRRLRSPIRQRQLAQRAERPGPCTALTPTNTRGAAPRRSRRGRARHRRTDPHASRAAQPPTLENPSGAVRRDLRVP